MAGAFNTTIASKGLALFLAVLNAMARNYRFSLSLADLQAARWS
jgi:hypothetical protein